MNPSPLIFAVDEFLFVCLFVCFVLFGIFQLTRSMLDLAKPTGFYSLLIFFCHIFISELSHSCRHPEIQFKIRSGITRRRVLEILTHKIQHSVCILKCVESTRGDIHVTLN